MGGWRAAASFALDRALPRVLLRVLLSHRAAWLGSALRSGRVAGPRPRRRPRREGRQSRGRPRCRLLLDYGADGFVHLLRALSAVSLHAAAAAVSRFAGSRGPARVPSRQLLDSGALQD